MIDNYIIHCLFKYGKGLSLIKVDVNETNCSHAKKKAKKNKIRGAILTVRTVMLVITLE